MITHVYIPHAHVSPSKIHINFPIFFFLTPNQKQSGVVTELHEPTQPVYNEFSDNAIFTTYIVAGVSVLSLMTIVGVRVVKTLIKQDRLPQDLITCGGRFRRGGNEHTDALGEDDEIVTDYVHA